MSYYGSLIPVSKKIREEKGVHIFMLEQPINDLVNKHIERFAKEIQTLIDQFERNALSEIRAIKCSVSDIKNQISNMNKSRKLEVIEESKKSVPPKSIKDAIKKSL